jgi:hypothetical protein
MAEDLREDFSVILSATLTLLGLLIGFSFSMAISRYDERKNYEEAEANAIGTEYVRADLLPAADAAKVRRPLSFHPLVISSQITTTDCGFSRTPEPPRVILRYAKLWGTSFVQK